MNFNINVFRQHIFTLSDPEFEAFALQLFQYQAAENYIYKQFLSLLNIDPYAIKNLAEIPFLPIEFYKNHRITTGNFSPQAVFSSSGTSGNNTSYHYVANLALYEQCFKQCFELFYGPITDYVILALLPAYLERQGSSLIYMVERLVAWSGRPESGFYLYNHHDLAQTLQKMAQSGQKTLLLGVTFALLDFAEHFQMPLPDNIILMETGGMKGRREELLRIEVHEKLGHAFSLKNIHSEYGMTELLSQAYSQGNGIFACPPWMRILVRDPNDAQQHLPEGRAGVVNVIDLANIYSCAFIATSDIGRCLPKGEFEILGRIDASDLRGCNLLVAD